MQQAQQHSSTVARCTVPCGRLCGIVCRDACEISCLPNESYTTRRRGVPPLLINISIDCTDLSIDSYRFDKQFMLPFMMTCRGYIRFGSKPATHK